MWRTESSSTATTPCVEHTASSSDSDSFHCNTVTSSHTTAKPLISHVVISYSTPIAWFARGVWFEPPVKYSPTTSKQANYVRRGMSR